MPGLSVRTNVRDTYSERDLRSQLEDARSVQAVRCKPAGRRHAEGADPGAHWRKDVGGEVGGVLRRAHTGHVEVVGDVESFDHELQPRALVKVEGLGKARVE